MGKVILIVGPQGSGKTSKVEELTKGIRKVHRMDRLSASFFEADAHVYDGLPIANRYVLEELYEKSIKGYQYRELYSRVVRIKRPTLIIITSLEEIDTSGLDIEVIRMPEIQKA